MTPQHSTADTQLEAIRLLGEGKYDSALELLISAVKQSPDCAAWRNNLGNALLETGQTDAAIQQFRQAISLVTGYHLAFLGLARAYRVAGDSIAALRACQQGLRMRPHWPEMIMEYATSLEAADRSDEALRLLSAAIASDPSDHELNSRCLFSLNNSEITPTEVFEFHAEVGQLRPFTSSLSERRSENPENICVGFLSGDFRVHSVSFFSRSLFMHTFPGLKRVALANSPPGGDDQQTCWFQQKCDTFINIWGKSDIEVRNIVQEQGCDVLVDLSGHSSLNRLDVFDSRCVPLAINAIGYPDTTGHPGIDLRLTDWITDPEGSDHLATEKLMRMPECFLCYDPPAAAPAPEVRPEGRQVRFGCFASFNRISASTLRLWSDVMGAIPDCELVLKSTHCSDAAACAHMRSRASTAGIDPNRIKFHQRISGNNAHMKLWNQIDISLDVAPWNSTTVTCEALWMGVPVITLRGDRHSARVGASLLTAVGRPEWIAESPEHYVDIARRVAADREQRISWRLDCRKLISNSPLCNTWAYSSTFYSLLKQQL